MVALWAFSDVAFSPISLEISQKLKGVDYLLTLLHGVSVRASQHICVKTFRVSGVKNGDFAQT